MASKILKMIFHLDEIIVEPVYYLNQITVRMKYENGQRTDEVAGYVYLVTNTDTFDQISVFVEQSKPLLEPEKLEALQNSGEKIFVEFQNAVLKPFYSTRTNSLEDSIKADNVTIVKNN